MKLDIVIPVLNEESSLTDQVEKVLKYFDGIRDAGVDLGLIISDNGSTDATPEIASNLVQKFLGRVSYQRVPRPGVGLALKYSWGKSDADWVGYMDLDLATDLKHLAEVLSIIRDGEYDLIYGSRLSGGSVVNNRSIIREITSRLFNYILRNYLRVHVKDGMCGFKFLRRTFLEELIENGANCDGWFFCAAVVVVAEHKGLNVKELPVRWSDDPNSKVEVLPLTLRYLREMKALRHSLRLKAKI